MNVYEFTEFTKRWFRFSNLMSKQMRRKFSMLSFFAINLCKAKKTLFYDGSSFCSNTIKFGMEIGFLQVYLYLNSIDHYVFAVFSIFHFKYSIKK